MPRRFLLSQCARGRRRISWEVEKSVKEPPPSPYLTGGNGACDADHETSGELACAVEHFPSHFLDAGRCGIPRPCGICHPFLSRVYSHRHRQRADRAVIELDFVARWPQGYTESNYAH